jgi:hypothetical protein
MFNFDRYICYPCTLFLSWIWDAEVPEAEIPAWCARTQILVGFGTMRNISSYNCSLVLMLLNSAIILWVQRIKICVSIASTWAAYTNYSFSALLQKWKLICTTSACIPPHKLRTHNVTFLHVYIYISLLPWLPLCVCSGLCGDQRNSWVLVRLK